MMTYSIDELKAEIDIRDVLEGCGAVIQNGWQQNEQPMFCPFHLNRNTPAASVNHMRGVFYCYSCGAGGSVVDAAMLHLGTKDVREACDWLEEEFLL